MGQQNRTRRFPSQTAAIPTIIQRDRKSKKSHTRPDRRRPQRIKSTRKFEQQTLENAEIGQLEFDLRVILCLFDDKGKTKLIVKPLRRREDKRHRRTRRHRRKTDNNKIMPTATAPSPAAERRRGDKATKKTKGNDGASKGGVTTGPDKIGAVKGKITNRFPSPERKNHESNKRQQKTDPVPPVTRSVNKKGNNHITKPITSFFSGEKTTKKQDYQHALAPKKATTVTNGKNKATKNVPKLNVEEQMAKRMEAVKARREAEKKATKDRAAKETEQLTFMGDEDKATDPSRVLKSGDQQDHGDKGGAVTMGVRENNEEALSEGGSKCSLDMEDMSLGMKGAGNDSMSLNSEERSLFDYFVPGKAEDATNENKTSDEPNVESPLPATVSPSINDQVPESSLGVEKSVTSTVTQKSTIAPSSKVPMTFGDDTPPVADESEQPTATQESTSALQPDVTMNCGEDTAGAILDEMSGGVNERPNNPSKDEESPSMPAAYEGRKDTGTSGIPTPKPTTQSTIRNSNPIPASPKVGEHPMQTDQEETDEEGEEDRPGKVCYVTMLIEEEYEDDAATFAYNSIAVAFSVLHDQINGFKVHPRDGSNLPPITSMDDIPPGIKQLEKYFTLRNPRWIDQYNESVKRKTAGIEVEPPKPKKKSLTSKFDDDVGYTFSGNPSLTVTLRISADEHLKEAIDRTRWYLPQIGTKIYWSQHQAGNSVVLGHFANMSSEIEINGLARTINHFMEKSFRRLGAEGKFTPDILALGLPSLFFAFRLQRGIEKKTKEMRAKSLNKDEWFLANGIVWLEIKCELRTQIILTKVLAHFEKHHFKDVCGTKAVLIPFRRGKPRQVDIDVLQRQKRIHCKYLQNTQLRVLTGFENMCKETEFRYEDGRKPARKFTSPLREMKALCVHVPHPKIPETTILKPVFDGVYINTDVNHCGTVSVMIVSDRREAWCIYEKMAKCPFAWLYGYWVSLGYAESMIRSIMDGLGPNTYHLAKHGSRFNLETLEVEVEFNDNQGELDLLEMEREFGLEEERGDKENSVTNQKVVIEMADARTLELFSGGRGDSMVADGGASRLSGFDGSVGASTVNADCPVRKREAHQKRAVENSLLKGQLADSDIRTRKLEEEVRAMKEMSNMAASMAALLSGNSSTADINSEEHQLKLKHIATLFTNMSAHTSEAEKSSSETTDPSKNKGTKRKVKIQSPVDGTACQDTANGPPSQVTPGHPEQREGATDAGTGLRPNNLLDKMSEQVQEQGDTVTRNAPSHRRVKLVAVQVGDAEPV